MHAVCNSWTSEMGSSLKTRSKGADSWEPTTAFTVWGTSSMLKNPKKWHNRHAHTHILGRVQYECETRGALCSDGTGFGFSMCALPARGNKKATCATNEREPFIIVSGVQPFGTARRCQERFVLGLCFHWASEGMECLVSLEPSGELQHTNLPCTVIYTCPAAQCVCLICVCVQSSRRHDGDHA
jgi:hypothetical protein